MSDPVDVKRAMRDPASVFDEPADVVGAPLSRDEKLRILKQWEQDARELSVAEEENMAGGEANLLGRVLAAERQVRNSSDIDD